MQVVLAWAAQTAAGNLISSVQQQAGFRPLSSNA
jgi:small-conductance mechanosensitive channel